MEDRDIRTTFTNENVIVELFDEATHSTIYFGEGVRDPLARLYKAPQIKANTETAVFSAENQPCVLWHRRLAPLNFRDLANTHKDANDVPPLHTSN